MADQKLDDLLSGYTCGDAPELEIEARAVNAVGSTARHFADLLPEDSSWKQLFGELGKSLAEDEDRLGLTPFLESFAPDKVEERSMVIAYTALWQLREVDPENEPENYRAARLELRSRLDHIDTLRGGAPNIELTRKERNVLAAELYLRLPEEAARLTEDCYEGTMGAAGSIIARYQPLWTALGSRKKIGRKKAKDKRWTVPVEVVAGALLHLHEKRRNEELELLDTINRSDVAPPQEAAARELLESVQAVLQRLVKINAKLAAAKGRRS